MRLLYAYMDAPVRQSVQARHGWLLRLIVFCLACGAPAHAAAGTGFLVVAPDRGFLGNQEIRTVFETFKVTYTAASLLFIGRDYTGIGSPYAEYVDRAVTELADAGATELVGIPFFLSDADPILQRVKASLPAYNRTMPMRWAASMADSYLIAQVLLDRAGELIQDPAHERMVIVGFGATDAAAEESMHHDLNKFIDYLSRYRPLREASTVVYYDRAAPDAEDRNSAADATLTRMAAKKGRTLAVLATLAPKFDHVMAFAASLKQKFHDIDVTFPKDELLPHPNVLRWLKKTANAYLPAAPAEIGVVIMPHGANQIWNDGVDRVIAPLRSKYQIEMAYGMGDSGIIQEAIARLESRNIRRIVFVRMYALARHLQARTDYILGLAEFPAAAAGHGSGHDGRGAVPPPQVRSAAMFVAFGGYEESPDVPRILHERIVEISRDPNQETVILVAHGEKTDNGNAAWLSLMHTHIERLKQDPHCARLKAIHAATVREDWPEHRARAVNDVRKIIQDASQQGRALVIADRLYGAGPYRTLFDGLEYSLNDKGLAHPVLTQWLETGIANATAVLAQPIAAEKVISTP
jgi:hypothetical protein